MSAFWCNITSDLVLETLARGRQAISTWSPAMNVVGPLFIVATVWDSLIHRQGKVRRHTTGTQLPMQPSLVVRRSSWQCGTDLPL